MISNCVLACYVTKSDSIGRVLTEVNIIRRRVNFLLLLKGTPKNLRGREDVSDICYKGKKILTLSLRRQKINRKGVIFYEIRSSHIGYISSYFLLL